MTGHHDTSLDALSRAVSEAADPQVMRIVAAVDALAQRGPADALIEPLRQRLTALRPPRPLRFGRLLFQPLDMVIVPAQRWRADQPAIPRSALMPLTKAVRQAMGADTETFDAQVFGHTTADTALISRLGRSLWPAAASILADMKLPKTWRSTRLDERHFRPLADLIAVLLAEAVAIDTLHAEAATGMLPPRQEAIAATLNRVACLNDHALPMLIAILLDRLPEACDLLPRTSRGSAAVAIRAAMEPAAELLLLQFDQDDSIDTRIAIGSLADAGAAAGRMITLLKHLESGSGGAQRRDRIRADLQHLDAACQARFTAGVQDELLTRLQAPLTADADMQALEAVARGLRVLETEARGIGGGATYDRLLQQAARAVRDETMQQRLSPADRTRLIEILSGPDAALAMLLQPS
jgi:hypothetical protein